MNSADKLRGVVSEAAMTFLKETGLRPRKLEIDWTYTHEYVQRRTEEWRKESSEQADMSPTVADYKVYKIEIVFEK